MRSFVLFTDPKDVWNPEMPNKDRRVIRVLAQVVPETDDTHRASIGDMEDGLLVYVPWFEESCLGTGFDVGNLSCANWWLVRPPYNLQRDAPHDLRLYGPVRDVSLLGSLDVEVIMALRDPAAQSA